MDHVQLTEGLRKIANRLKEQAVTYEQKKVEKCAHVLIAANGLHKLHKIIHGELS